MFADTGGEFTGTPSINTTYYLHKSNAIVGSKLSVSVAQMMDYDDATGLPELPDRNKEIHPYALIHSTSLNSTRHLIFSGCQIRQDVTVLEEVTPNNWVHYIADEGDESWIFIESSDTTAYTSGLAGIWWANYDVYHVSNDALYRAASEPVVIGNCVTENTATINFTCKDLLSTDAVYHIKAWCYPKGMDYWTAPATWESDLFAGPTHSESVTFTGLLPGVEYEVYAVIYGTDGATEHNAVTTFTTVASEEETPQAVVQYNELTATSFTAWLFTQGLEAGTDYTAEFSVRPKDTSIDTTPVIYKDVYFTGEDGFKAHSCEFTGLLPNTTYTVNVDLYPSDGSASIIACDCEVTTLEGVPVVVRDAFPLGFASGLCGLPITEADADYNTWAQGHIVGAAMRKAL